MRHRALLVASSRVHERLHVLVVEEVNGSKGWEDGGTSIFSTDSSVRYIAENITEHDAEDLEVFYASEEVR